MTITHFKWVIYMQNVLEFIISNYLRSGNQILPCWWKTRLWRKWSKMLLSATRCSFERACFASWSWKRYTLSFDGHARTGLYRKTQSHPVAKWQKEIERALNSNSDQDIYFSKILLTIPKFRPNMTSGRPSRIEIILFITFMMSLVCVYQYTLILSPG